MERSEQSGKGKLALGLMGGAVALGGLWYMFRPKEAQAGQMNFSREEILRVSRQFRRNYYPVLKHLWSTYERIAVRYRMTYGTIPETVKKGLKTALMDTNPQFHKLMSDLEDEVYQKNGITDRKGFEKAALELSKTDNELKLIYQSIREDLANACNGVKMAMNVSLESHITPETTLTVYKSMVYSILIQLNDFVKEYVKEHGAINSYDEEFNRKLSETLNPEKIKKEFLSMYKYDYSQTYHENLIYASAIKEFSKRDPNYSNVIKKIDGLNNEMLKQHLMPGQDYARLRERIEEVMVVGVELTQPLIEVAPDAEEILKKKEEEEQQSKTEVDAQEAEAEVEEGDKADEVQKPEEVAVNEEAAEENKGPVEENKDQTEEKETPEGVELEETEDAPQETPKDEETPEEPKPEEKPEIPEDKEPETDNKSEALAQETEEKAETQEDHKMEEKESEDEKKEEKETEDVPDVEDKNDEID